MLSQIFKGKSVTNLSPVAQDMPAGSATSNYCVYACFEMILNKYGDQTNQKSIELAAIWTGLSPGVNQGVSTENIPKLGSILGLKNAPILEGQLEYASNSREVEDAIKGNIYAGLPMMIVQPKDQNFNHARILDGYRSFGGDNIFYGIDPNGGGRFSFPLNFYYNIETHLWRFYK